MNMNPLDYIMNDVADIKADVRDFKIVLQQVESQQHQTLGALIDMQASLQCTVEDISNRLKSMEQKFIDMNVIYPDLDNA
jgi:uncharacterized coiled-coil protein SlyX